MMLEIIISISLGGSLFFVVYLLILALRRITDYERYIIQIQQIVEFATERMKKIDASGHYESDDETQFFFQQLKDIQDVLANLFEIQQGEINVTKKEKE